MFDALSFTEIDGQHVELLPARTVLSLFSLSGGGDGSSTTIGGNTCVVAGANPGLLLGLLNPTPATITCSNPPIANNN